MPRPYDPLQPCPCESGLPLSHCCGPALAGTPAADPEALMRSRYTAFVLGDDDYLLASWHASTRPERVEAELGPEWVGLRIVKASAEGERGSVEFEARFLEGGRPGFLHETSRFVREAGRWFYLDGRIHPPGAAVAPGRNSPCPCGSGRKFKRCCGA